MAASQRKSTDDRRPSEYAKEAFEEWGKATRYGARALGPMLGATKAAASTAKLGLRRKATGKAGDLADAALAKFGVGGKLASKAGVGSRLVEKVAGTEAPEPGTEAPEAADAGANGAGNGNGLGAHSTIPIQESIEVAVPLKAAYALATGYADYPEWSDHVESVDVSDDSHLAFVAKVRGRRRELDLEIVDERPNERLDWSCSGGVESSGMVSFHEVAPRLTHIELAIEFEPEGFVERLTRSTHLSERAIRGELNRFKAYADLVVEPEEVEELTGEEEEAPVDEEPREEEPADQDEELVDEEEPLDEEELDEDEEFVDDEEPLDEEELDEDEEFVDDEEPLDEEELDEDEEFVDEEELEDEEPLDEEELDEEEPDEEDFDELDEDEELEPAPAER
jgi:uncharacterized membrane protein